MLFSHTTSPEESTYPVLYQHLNIPPSWPVSVSPCSLQAVSMFTSNASEALSRPRAIARIGTLCLQLTRIKHCPCALHDLGATWNKPQGHARHPSFSPNSPLGLPLPHAMAFWTARIVDMHLVTCCLACASETWSRAPRERPWHPPGHVGV
jgi:hypothetical protein